MKRETKDNISIVLSILAIIICIATWILKQVSGVAENKTSEAQLKAAKKWNDKNKDKQRVYRYRSYARKYVRDIASQDDLLELRKMIDERLS